MPGVAPGIPAVGLAVVTTTLLDFNGDAYDLIFPSAGVFAGSIPVSEPPTTLSLDQSLSESLSA